MEFKKFKERMLLLFDYKKALNNTFNLQFIDIRFDIVSTKYLLVIEK